MKQRIWELDAFRGLCIIGMVAVHLVYDLTELFQLVNWDLPGWFSIVQSWGGVLFILLSGICATLGSAPIRRGIAVFACGMICTLVTVAAWAMGMDQGIVIWFGVLHCLGACMLLWKPVSRLPAPALGALGGALAILGFGLQNIQVEFPWLIPLGIAQAGFRSGDYFPLILNFGWFLIGACLGKSLYREKQTRFPRVNEAGGAVRFLRWCGRKSLPIYLLHQPAIIALLALVAWLG